MNIKSCTQEKCCYHPTNNKKINIEITQDNFIDVNTKDLCPECSECGCEPHKIDEDCTNCWNCLKDEGFIRQGTPKFIKDGLKEKMVSTIIQENEQQPIEVVIPPQETLK